MKEIRISVRNKIAMNLKNDTYVCDNGDYQIVFDFDGDWEEHPVKTARVKYNGMFQEVVFSGNVCNMPVVRDARLISVGVYAGNIQTSTPAVVHASQSILSGDAVHEEPEEDVYHQLVKLVESGVLQGPGGKSAYDLAVENGYIGSETEWLASLRGAPGKTPEFGVDYGTKEQIDGIAKQAAEILKPEVNQINDDLHVLTVNDKRQDRRVRMLELAADGVLYTEETDTDTAYEKTIPSGVLPYATLGKIGGATISDGDVLKSASVDKVLSIGKNILKPYPGYRTFGNNATSTVIIKGSKKNVVGLAEVKPGEKIKLYSISGASFADRRYFWFTDNPIVRHDDIVSIGGGYGQSLYNGEILTVPENAKFLAVLMTDTNDKNQYWSARRDLVAKYVPYFERELQIPEEIRSLQGYGQSNGEKVNTVDYANKVYRKAGYYGDDGQWVDNAENIDISALIPEDFEILEVEEGGTLTFHHPEADNGLPIPMPSKENYIVKMGGTAV